MAPVIPCPLLVGRATELEALEAALDLAAQGTGQLVVLAGDAGVGKSRLAAEAAALAEARAMRVLRGRAVPGSATVPYRPLAEALVPVLPETGEGPAVLGSWWPALAAIAGATPHREPAEATGAIRGEALIRFLDVTCGPGGGLLLLEDLHWADPETLAIVEQLSDNLRRVPVLGLVTVRTEERSAGRELARRLATRRSGTVLALAHLNVAQVAAMVHGCTGGGDEGLVERIVQLADGVPFLVEELLVSDGLPPTLTEAIEERVAALPEPDQRVLVTAAAIGRHFDWRVLPTATALPRQMVVESLDRAVAASLLAVEGDGFLFRHALTAEAVFHSVTPPHRESAAAAALAALDERHPDRSKSDREEVARLAERAGHVDRAGALHLAAGEDSLRRGAVQSAVVALERARELLPAGEERDRAGERLVHALVDAGRADDAERVARELAERLPQHRAALHLRLAGAASTAARPGAAAGHVEAARRSIDDSAPEALRAELLIREAAIALETGDADGARAPAREALGIARDAALGGLACEALQLLGRLARRSSLEEADRRFRELLATAEHHDLPLWRLRARHELGTIGLLERSEVGELVDVQALAESLGAMATAAILDVEIAAGCAGLHDLEGEARHGERAVARGSALGMELVVAHGWLHVAGAVTLAGDAAAAARAGAAALAAAPGNRDVEALLLSATEVMAALMHDDLERALDAAVRAAELARGSRTVAPAHPRAAWPLLLAALDQPGAAEAADELDSAGLSVSGAGRGAIRMARAIVAGRADPAAASALAARALGDLRYVPLWQQLATRLAVPAAARDGWSLPDGQLGEAERWLRDHGYAAVADACAGLHSELEHGVPAPWSAIGVTRREADVLRLVIEGCSNRAIAERLHLSVRTVEKHVESLLRRTATTSRTQLARVATLPRATT